jgi:hypothetical protein
MVPDYFWKWWGPNFGRKSIHSIHLFYQKVHSRYFYFCYQGRPEAETIGWRLTIFSQNFKINYSIFSKIFKKFVSYIDQKKQTFRRCRCYPTPFRNTPVCQKIDSFFSLFRPESPSILFTFSGRNRELKNRK